MMDLQEFSYFSQEQKGVYMRTLATMEPELKAAATEKSVEKYQRYLTNVMTMAMTANTTTTQTNTAVPANQPTAAVPANQPTAAVPANQTNTANQINPARKPMK